jgi:diguanylate cyclase (GGDEF)-like protein
MSDQGSLRGSMQSIINCIVNEHDYRGLVVASLVCVIGSLISMRLFARTRRTTGGKRVHWLLLSAIVCGCTIWTTHFIAMLGYEPPVIHAYDPILTLVSLLIAIGASLAAFVVSSSTRSSFMIEAGGAILGLGVAAMHFTGMFAFVMTGYFVWDMTMVVVAVMLGAVFGAVAMNRIARPVTRFCKYGSSIALVLAIVSMHFTAMGSFSIVYDPTLPVPSSMIANEVLLAGVVGIMSMVLLTGVSTHVLDNYAEADAIRHYRHMALHDAATGLPNRSDLQSKLAALTVASSNDNDRAAILTIDLDRFKDINDVHGHAAGDFVLRVVSERLSSALRANEYVARIGGDEFVAIKRGLYAISEAREFAARLNAVICQPAEEEGRVLTVGASVGICIFPDHGRDPADLVSKSDLAMYRAKQSSTDKICIYNPSMDEASRTRSALAIELRHALERGQLELYYQPQNDVASGRLIGFEALIRWNHPIRGLVSPAEFIPIAEDTGLITPIGEWVIRKACEEAAQWALPLKVAVNVSPSQFTQSDLPKIVHEALLQSGLAAQRLELEITESSIIADQQHALHVVRQLKSYGVSIAMDDYGTGYSSLSTLQTFPFDKIKIDRSFIGSVHSSDQAAAIIRATIILAESLNIPVLAEGVETERHLQFLRDEGCGEAQGYFFSRPIPAAAAAQMAVDAAENPIISIEPASEAAPVVLRKIA